MTETTPVIVNTNNINQTNITQPTDDIKTDRPRWRNKWTFVISAVGCSIGIGNVWRFPYLTFKHGGITFILTYIWALFIVGIPMLILELTLGQKMQRGSAGSMRGIVPRLAGIGWVASFSGFVTCLIYNVLLGMCIIYLLQSGSEPWAAKNFNPTRSLSCSSAEMMPKPTEEIYLYQNVIKLYGNEYCQVFQLGDPSVFATPLFFANLFCWIYISLSLAIGPKLIEMKAIVTLPLRFILIIIFVIKFAGLNSSVLGEGIGWYLGGDPFPLPTGAGNPTEFMQFDDAASTLFPDAYGQVFFSLGVCFGTMFAYGSYNKTKEPIILNAFLIGIIDFLFSFIAGFGVWGGIGYLQKQGNIAYTQSSSVGLIFIAMPAAAVESGNAGTLGLLMFTLWISGIDSAVGFVEGAVTNIIDHTGCKRWKSAFIVVFFGIILSTLFCSNWGWVLFDLVDHYVSNYIVLPVGLCQCIAVGWIFERQQTAARSPEHATSMRILGVLYWFPVLIVSFYTQFGFPEQSIIGIIVIFVTTMMAFFFSYRASKLHLISWYHEILMCGTDKIAMSISILSNQDQTRSWWMLPFEAYFGILMKFVNPACLIMFIFKALATDLKTPFGITQGYMPVFASIYIFIAILIIFGPMIMCDYPEQFTHNVEKEFLADDIFETQARLAKGIHKMKKKKAKASSEATELVPSSSKVTPTVQADPEQAVQIEANSIGGVEETAKINEN